MLPTDEVARLAPFARVSLSISMISSTPDHLPKLEEKPTAVEGGSQPSLDLATVVMLSTIKRQVTRSPFRSFGSTDRRNKGASVGSVVNAQMVIELVASKLSSCRMTAGRGLPA